MLINKLFLELAFLVCFTYITYVWIKYGIQKSISKSYYVIKYKILFVLFSWLTAAFLNAYFNHWLIAIASAGLVLVGAASGFEENKTTKIVHWTGAIMAILFSELYILFVLNQYYLFYSFLGILIFISIFVKKNQFWWIEIFAILNIFLSTFKLF